VIDAAFAEVGQQGIEVIRRAIEQAAVLLSCFGGVFIWQRIEENDYETLVD